ncbi:VOC family protein [Nonomuraea sp. NPDC050310]|uniref:VOC family protein n=1 Tax=unclassified Nonomuraea TaxID=2593643 RepID=UPI0033E123B3
MVHYSRMSVVVIDAPDETHDAEVAFWQGALGRPFEQIERFPEYHQSAELGYTGDLGLLVQRLGEGEAKVHLDIHTDDVAAETARLEALGAVRVRAVNGWQVMRDPAGLHFCVIPDPPGRLNDGNAQRWD